MTDEIEMTIPPWKTSEGDIDAACHSTPSSSSPSPSSVGSSTTEAVTNNNSASSSFFTSLKFQKNLSRVIANSNCILIEPISTPTLRTLIPLDQVISVRSCYCKRFPKKLTCECIEQDYLKTSILGSDQSPRNSDQKCDSLEGRNTFGRQSSKDSVSSNDSREEVSVQSNSTTNNNTKEKNGKKYNNSKESLKSSSKRKSRRDSSRIQAVRVYYAVPVGKFQWKVTCLPLMVPYQETADQQLLDNNSDGEHSLNSSSSSNPSIPPSASRVLHNQVLGWVSNVSKLLEGFNRPKNLLVFINPFGGKKKAPQIYREKVEPILRLSGINYTVILTQRANHARDLLLDIESNDLCDYHGFVCVGGDGMFAELLNGMIIRRQKQEGVDYMSPSVSLSRPVVPVGVIPAGSTDAVSFGVTGINDPVTSTVHVIFGKTINIDISAVHENSTSEGKLLRYATSVLGYGFLADVLVDSEKNRWMGPKRYDWAGFKKLLSLKAYEGEIKLRISTSDGSPRDSDLCQSDCTLCANSGLRSKFAGENALIHDHQHQLQEEQHKKEEGPAVETNLDNDSSVVTIRGKFLSVNAATMSCRCEKSKKGLSPAAHLGNGCSDLIIVSQCSRLDYIRFLMRTGYSTSESPFDLPFVDVYRVKEFSYRPLNQEQTSEAHPQVFPLNDNNNRSHESRNNNKNKTASNNNGVWNCDGEVIDSSAIRVKNHCQLLPVFGVGLENRFMNRTMPVVSPPNLNVLASQRKIPFDNTVKHPLIVSPSHHLLVSGDADNSHSRTVAEESEAESIQTDTSLPNLMEDSCGTTTKL